jgi:hypothetical protein
MYTTWIIALIQTRFTLLVHWQNELKINSYLWSKPILMITKWEN